ncbi:MAG: UDP-3-O-(3-hydroxymyristoyl)glucosamine N-acyltransferase [Gemmatimonadaceae bacterium]|nr:UDP-3-O-(3-hydroxymyristoyl)glucosamine N-acyltransferase [Gemmatimonadaceae bacterium]
MAAHGHSGGLTAAEIAVAAGGVLTGDGGARVEGVAALNRAGPADASFLAHARYAQDFAATGAAVVLMAPDLKDLPGPPRARVVVEKPYDALLAILPRLYPPRPFVPGRHPSSVIDPSAVLGRDVRVDPFAVIGADARIGDRAWIGAHAVVGEGTTIGDDSRLFPHVVLYPGTSVGARSILHAGVRGGSDGFGYAFGGGAHNKIPHVGRCIIGNDVEVGANSTIDRGSIDDTVIGDGTKIDNLVHIAHNVKVGRLCLIMAQVGIAGSAHIEDGAVIAGQAGIAGHQTIGKGARIAAQAGVFGGVPAGETWSGYPARPHRDALRAQAALFKLAGLMRKIGKLVDGDGK